MYEIPDPPESTPVDYTEAPSFLAQLRSVAEAGGGTLTAPREVTPALLRGFWLTVEKKLPSVWCLMQPVRRNPGQRVLAPADPLAGAYSLRLDIRPERFTEDGGNEVGNLVYRLGAILFESEGEHRCRWVGNGHHAAQELAEHAVRLWNGAAVRR